MPDGSLGSPVLPANEETSVLSLSRLVDWLLPVGFALLFLAYFFQPRATFGDASVDVTDLVVAAIVVAAARAVWLEGAGRLRPALPLWIAAAALLAWIAAASLYPLATDAAYRWRSHLVTAAKYGEYALLAPACAVLIRDRQAMRRLWTAVAGWAAAAGVVAALQFSGVHIFRAWPAGSRQPSFTGIADLGTLGGAALAIGFLALLWPGSVPRPTAIVALVAGAADVALSGAAATGLGVGAAAIVGILVVRRRGRVDWRAAAGVAAVTAVCAVAVVAIRSGDIEQFARYVGLAHKNSSTTRDVQTYAQRSLMLYIGFRVWEAHPVLGAGWQSIKEPEVYSPFLAAAHRRFPDQPEVAFPSPTRPWRIDNAYVQALADLGVVGFALFAAFLATGLTLAVRCVLRARSEQARWALVGLLWLLVAMGVWVGEGLVAGAGYTALSWLALGLVASARAGVGG